MNELSLSDLEARVDELLDTLAQSGLLDTELKDADLDQFLATTSKVPISNAFMQRALKAMSEAQAKREELNPAVALGFLVSQARHEANLKVEEVSGLVGVSTKLLEALEQGQLSARQIIRTFPPDLIVRLLSIIGLAVNTFTDRLLNLRAGTEIFSPTSSKLAYQRSQEDPSLTMDMAKYVATIEQIVRSE